MFLRNTFDFYPLNSLPSKSVFSSVAVFNVMRWTCHCKLLYDFHPVCLAGNSKSLNSYVISIINLFCLAGIGEPDSFQSGIRHLSFTTVAVFAFLLCEVGFEPTFYRLEDDCFTIKQLATNQDVLPLLFRILLKTKSNTPNAFLLARYLAFFQDS